MKLKQAGRFVSKQIQPYFHSKARVLRAQLWNKLPAFIKTSNSLCTFRNTFIAQLQIQSAQSHLQAPIGFVIYIVLLSYARGKMSRHDIFLFVILLLSMYLFLFLTLLLYFCGEFIYLNKKILICLSDTLTFVSLSFHIRPVVISWLMKSKVLSFSVYA